MQLRQSFCVQFAGNSLQTFDEFRTRLLLRDYSGDFPAGTFKR